MSAFQFNTNMLQWQMRVAAEKYEDPIKKIIKSALDSSCTIYVQDQNEQWTGSGFHIGGGLVATAGHVLPGDLKQRPHKIAITFDGQTLYPAEIGVTDPNIDSAIMLCPAIAHNIPSVKLGDSNTAEVGDIVAAIGSPEGFHDTATVGRISNIHQSLGPQAPTPAWSDILFIDADIHPGSSGGMVIGTDGLVYGSVMGVTGQEANIGVGERAACPSNKIIELAKKLG